jgi:hypothetical protein
MNNVDRDLMPGEMAGILKNREMNQSMQQRILGIHQLVQ